MYSFSCYGHKNITASHKTTLEFTKDKDIGRIAHCIIGVNADFSLEKIRKEISKKDSMLITICAKGLKEEIRCLTNKWFNVVRKSEFSSERTLGLRGDKASSDLSKELKNKLKDPTLRITVTIR
jgi:hypothetical protein